VKPDPVDALYPNHLETVAQRADAALEASGFESLVVHAGAPLTLFLDDQDYPFKPNPHFKAWVPIDHPGCVLVYRPGANPRVLFPHAEDYWHKPAPLPTAAWTHSVEIVPISDPAMARSFWTDLPSPAFIGPAQVFAGENNERINPPALMARLHFDRAVKTGYELECMRRANQLGVRGHRAARRVFESGGSEFAAQMGFLQACGQREQDLPYGNIVAINENAAVLHYQHLEGERPADARSFLIDAGAQFRGYASDITRTYATRSGLFADLVDALDEAQQLLCDLIRPGTDYRDVHLAAHRELGEVLHRLRIIDMAGEDASQSGLTATFFPHGIGHLLGLQVHDVGGVMGDAQGQERARPKGHPYLRLTRLLEPGVVVTVEPGIYLIDSLLAQAHADERRQHIDWDKVEMLRPFGGIRIEDNVATTVDGPENMTRDAFAGLAAH
jgi:Xaa-Pro dipeptidase